MASKELQFTAAFHKILDTIDFDDLDTSCNSTNNAYAKRILQQIHDVFIKIYGNEPLNKNTEFISLPAVIKDKDNHLYIGRVILNLSSSGEHWETEIITTTGPMSSNYHKNYFKNHLCPYEYYYTPMVENDIHVNYSQMTENIKNLMPTEFLTK